MGLLKKKEVITIYEFIESRLTDKERNQAEIQNWFLKKKY